MKRRGDISSGQLILVIIGIISFVILLFFLYRFPWGEHVDRETCHQSIIMRSAVNYGPIQSSKIIPLKCQTDKVCLSISGDNCEKEFLKPSKTNSVYRRTVPKEKDKSLEKIKEEYANLLYDCHSMVGEGQLSFMPNSFWDKNYCLICSRFVAGKDLREKNYEISYMELYEYMRDIKTPDGRSYLKATFDAETLGEMKERLEKVRLVMNQNTPNKIERVEDLKINISSQNNIIVQTIPKSTWKTWLAAGSIGIAVTGVILAPFTAGGSLTLTAVGVAIGAGGVTTGIIYVKNAPDGSGYAYPAIYPYDLESLRDLKCSSFETAP